MSNMPGNDSADEFTLLRVPPHSIEAESSLLGALLLDNTSLDLVTEFVGGPDFYRHEHKVIFSAIHDLVSSIKPADVVTVYERLQGEGRADEVGGLDYLNKLAQYVPSSANIRRYAEIVRERSILRKLSATGEAISRSAYDLQGRSVTQVLDEAETQVLAINDIGFARNDVKTLEFQKTRFIELLQQRAEDPGKVSGVKSGYPDLDRSLGGFQNGDLIVLAARPSMGKTALAINIAENAAFLQGLPVLVISLEMTADQLTTRIVGSIGKIDQSKLKSGNLSQDEWSRVFDTLDVMSGDLDIEDLGVETVSAIRSVARRALKRKGSLGIIIVDYLQLIQSDRGENRNAEITHISRGLKLLAKELNCPVIALSQLSRKVEERGDKRPMMSDLRESGAIEQDADIIMFIYREDYYKKEISNDPSVAEIIIAKHRNGPTTTVQLLWKPEFTRFDDFNQ